MKLCEMNGDCKVFDMGIVVGDELTMKIDLSLIYLFIISFSNYSLLFFMLIPTLLFY